MKLKSYFFYLMLLAGLFSAVSCKQEDEQEIKPGGGLKISTPGITLLDKDATFNITAQNPAVTNIMVLDAPGGSVLAEVPVQSGKGTVALTKEALGLNEEGAGKELYFETNIESKATYTSSIEMVTPIMFEKGTIGQIDTANAIVFSVEPVSATVSNVVAEMKTGSKGAYMQVSAPDGKIPLTGSNYNVGDTIYVRVTATSPFGQAVAENFYPVRMRQFLSSSTGRLDTTANVSYDFVGQKVVMGQTGDSADVKFVSVPLLSQGLEGIGATFVAIDAATYETADAFAAEKMIDAAIAQNTATKSLMNLTAGDSFIYKTMRGTTAHYGMIQVSEVNASRDNNQDFVAFEQKFN